MARKGKVGRDGKRSGRKASPINPALAALRLAQATFEACEHPGTKKKGEKDGDQFVIDKMTVTIALEFHRIQAEKPRKIKRPWRHCRKPRDCARAGKKGAPKHSKYRFRRGGNGARIG